MATRYRRSRAGRSSAKSPVKIAVLADTHDRVPAGLFEQLRAGEEIWHLGDVVSPGLIAELRELGKPVRLVRGNCDDTPEWPLTLAFELEGWRVRLLHIPPRTAPAGCDLLLHGHTHVPRNEMIGKTRFLNPGCITRPNAGAPASFAWLELRRGEPLCWELVPSGGGPAVRRF